MDIKTNTFLRFSFFASLVYFKLRGERIFLLLYIERNIPNMVE